jgi:myosin-5
MARGIAARAGYLAMRKERAALLIQSHVRMCRAREEFLSGRRATVALQCAWRCKMARRAFATKKREAQEAGALLKAKSEL